MAFVGVFAKVLKTPIGCAFRLRLGASALACGTSRNQSMLAFPRVDYGGHMRAPYHKDTCEDACFILPVEEVVGFGRLHTMSMDYGCMAGILKVEMFTEVCKVYDSI